MTIAELIEKLEAEPDKDRLIVLLSSDLSQSYSTTGIEIISTNFVAEDVPQCPSYGCAFREPNSESIPALGLWPTP